MPKVILPDRPFVNESYHDWRKRRRIIWGKKMTELEKNRIRGCIAVLAMIIAEKKENKGRRNGS